MLLNSRCTARRESIQSNFPKALTSQREVWDGAGVRARAGVLPSDRLCKMSFVCQCYLTFRRKLRHRPNICQLQVQQSSQGPLQKKIQWRGFGLVQMVVVDSISLV